MKHWLNFSLIFCFLALVSCGMNPEQKAAIGIDEALTLLSKGKCGQAIEILEDLDDQSKNPVWIKTLASAYACKASIDVILFVDSDIDAIDENLLFESLSILTYSDETAVDSSGYVGLRDALDILGRTDFTQTTRNADFGQRHGEDMGVQTLVYAIIELGKYINWYGNVDAVGKKGAGTNSNSCYLNYTYGPAIAIVSGLPPSNACNSTNDGHPDLNGAQKITRVCEGLTLMTNIIDILETIDLSSSSTLSSLEDLVVKLETYRVVANAVGVGYLLDVTSPTACETLLANATDMNNAELLFALILEQDHE